MSAGAGGVEAEIIQEGMAEGAEGAATAEGGEETVTSSVKFMCSLLSIHWQQSERHKVWPK